MSHYVIGLGTTTELVVLQIIWVAIWSANLHFHWFNRCAVGQMRQHCRQKVDSSLTDVGL